MNVFRSTLRASSTEHLMAQVRDMAPCCRDDYKRVLWGVMCRAELDRRAADALAFFTR